ncbi:MAG: ABC transporter permease [Myxococcaceae bacterium]|nr:ABC transporter permease [Myxococcaceae bacterium]
MPTKARAKPSLWAVRGSLPASTGRLASGLAVGLLFAAWSVCAYVTKAGPDGEPVPLVSHFFLPAPHEVLQALGKLWFDFDLAGSVGASAKRIGLAFVLSVIVALPLGIAMGAFEVVNRFFNPLVAPMRYLPITAFIPLLIFWLGIEEEQKVAFLFLGTVVYLLPAVVDAIRAVPEELVQTAQTLGASRAQVVRTVLIPAALPQIFDSFRTVNAIAWTYIILAELVNSKTGIGFILHEAEQKAKPAWIFAGILVVGVVGLVTDKVIDGVNRLLFGWRESNA